MNLHNFIKVGGLLAIKVANHLLIMTGVIAVGISTAYLGFRTVMWIRNTCTTNPTIQHVFHLLSKKQTAPQQILLTKNVSNLTVPDGVIKIGQGEYVLFRDIGNGVNQPIQDLELYKRCYQVLEEYSPSSILERLNGEDGLIDCQNRYELLSRALAGIDPSVKAVFVPRTLYELIFIRKCIQEDLKYDGFCSGLRQIILRGQISEPNSLRKKCYHLCLFDQNRAIADPQNKMVENLKIVAFQMHKAIFKTLEIEQHREGLTYNELSEYVDHEIQYLQEHHTSYKDKQLDNFKPLSIPSPVVTFCNESNFGGIKSMSFNRPHCTLVAQNAHKLDCSELAASTFILYRGALFNNDSVVKEEGCQSLSFGIGLFSGFMFDGGATAFHYMWEESNDSYALPVPYAQVKNSVFFVPNTNTLTQLFGAGEVFHGRTKSWKGVIPGGVQIHSMNPLKYLSTTIPKEEFIRQFDELKKEAFNLKT